MGMFDSFYDENNAEWQTKAFENLLTAYRAGDNLPSGPFTYQVKIIGGPGGPRESVHSLATITEGTLTAINVSRDESLPLMDYHGSWITPDKEEYGGSE